MRDIERVAERLKIRRARPEDAEARFRWFSDAAVTEFLPLAGERNLPLESIVEFLAKASREDEPNLNVGIELLSGRQIGCGGLREIVPGESAEVSVVIGERDVWGLGYGREAMGLLLREGFAVLNLKSIWLIVREENVRAVRLFSQLGFVVTETLHAAAVVKGIPRTKLRMQLEASAWTRK
ncbi:MAG TPA: GNAT family N-acetyltransferase [Polyangiaceae bacterium]|jgi:RimJ/RimL family protein N-acetyltransferase|nr:GNAT family N-acetyltransferase [Polyangiaceae bacterium]